MDDNYSDLAAGINELTEQDKIDLINIDQSWKTFQLGMNEAKDVLRRCHAEFKSGMEQKIEDYKNEVKDNKESFNSQAPKAVTVEFTAENNKLAFEKIMQFQQQCKSLREREEDMQFGLDIFNIERTQYVELAQVERENESLLKLWNIKQKWDHQLD